MISAADELKIFQNILAQSPEGLSDPNLIGKFAKAKAQLHMMSSMEAIQAQNMMPTGVPQNPQGTMMGQPPQSTSQEPLGAIPNQNQSPTPMEGNGTLNLPQ